MQGQPIDKFIESILGLHRRRPMDKEFECLTSDGDEVHELTWWKTLSTAGPFVKLQADCCPCTVTRLPKKMEGYRRGSASSRAA
jgi:hypothetical protein